jgi:hypothetical protein
VEEVCTLTRDQADDPELRGMFGGYVICYAHNQGGLYLSDLDGDLPPEYMHHKIWGDLQRQQQTRTENQRRLSMWQASGVQAANHGEQGLARLFWQGEHDIRTTGFVSGTVLGDLMKAFASRGIEGP